jgi:hypothetical protein
MVQALSFLHHCIQIMTQYSLSTRPWDCLILAGSRMYKNQYTEAPIQQTHVPDFPSCSIFFGLLLISPTKLCCVITSQLHCSLLWLYLEYWTKPACTHTHDHFIGQFIPLLLFWEVFAYSSIQINKLKTPSTQLILLNKLISCTKYRYIVQLDNKPSSCYSNIHIMRKCYCGLRVLCQTETCCWICYKKLISLTSWWFFLTNNKHTH